jgi:membrane-bound lytic murein transglycosylase B
MMQSMAGLAKRGGSVTGATMIATALLFPLPASAQAQNGLSNLFGGIFSGPNQAPSPAAPGPSGAQT